MHHPKPTSTPSLASHISTLTHPLHSLPTNLSFTRSPRTPAHLRPSIQPLSPLFSSFSLPSHHTHTHPHSPTHTTHYSFQRLAHLHTLFCSADIMHARVRVSPTSVVGTWPLPPSSCPPPDQSSSLPRWSMRHQANSNWHGDELALP